MALDMKKLTRAQAERHMQLIGLDIETADGPVIGKPDYREFMSHANYHVRNKAWKKMGKPVPSDRSPVELKTFFDGLHYKPTTEEQQRWYALPITEAEVAEFEATKSEEEWNKLCDKLKDSRNGLYPSDWFAKMIQGGVSSRKQSEWAAAAKAAEPAAEASA